MIIQTERLTIRPLAITDAPDIVTLLNQPSFLKNIGDKEVRDETDAIKYIQEGPLAMLQAKGYSMYALVLKESNKFIGLCGLIKRDGIELPEIGYSLIEDYHGKGYGKESCLAVLTHAKNTLKIDKLQAITNPENTISISLLNSLGFHYLKQVNLPQGDLVNLYEKTL